MSRHLTGGSPLAVGGSPFLTHTGVGAGSLHVVLLIATGVDDDGNPTSVPTITPSEGSPLVDFTVLSTSATRIFGQVIESASGADITWTSDIQAQVFYRADYTDDTVLAEFGSEMVTSQSAFDTSSSVMYTPALSYTSTITNVYSAMLITAAGTSLHGIHSSPDGEDQVNGFNPVEVTYLNHTHAIFGPEIYSSQQDWATLSFGWQVPSSASWIIGELRSQ